MTQQAKETSPGTRSLSEAFSRINAKRVSNAVLKLESTWQSFNYDFVLRIMYGNYGAVTPFSQLDHDVLIEARDKLIALGGKPPELSPETPTPQATPPGLRL